LPEQSFQILAMLLERPGELVTREEIQKRLWPDDTIVEFENSISAAIRRLRLALGDSADEPRFVETLARRGYRFMVEVERPPEAGNRAQPSPVPSPEVVASTLVVSLAKRRRKALLAGLAVLAVLALGLYRFLARGPAGPAREAIDSIAVLPFQNVGGDPDTEYLSDGITEGIISTLSRLPRLRVMARSMVFHYKGSDVDPRKIGGDLKVRAVMTGRVALRGNTLTISTEMMDVADGSQLWGEQYSRKLADAIAIQEEMAREISERLRLRITGEEKRLLTRRYTENAEAYEFYLRRVATSGIGANGARVEKRKTLNEASSISSRPLPETPGMPWRMQAWPIHSGRSPSSIAWRSKKILKEQKPPPPRHSKLTKQSRKPTFPWQWSCSLGTGIGQARSDISSGASS